MAEIPKICSFYYCMYLQFSISLKIVFIQTGTIKDGVFSVDPSHDRCAQSPASIVCMFLNCPISQHIGTIFQTIYRILKKKVISDPIWALFEDTTRLSTLQTVWSVLWLWCHNCIGNPCSLCINEGHKIRKEKIIFEGEIWTFVYSKWQSFIEHLGANV